MRINPAHSVRAAVRGLTSQSRICSNRVWCLLKSAFEHAASGTNPVVLWCGLKPATGYVVSEPLGRYSSVDQCQMLPVTSPGLPVSSYKVIDPWLVPSFVGPGCLWNEPSCILKLASNSTNLEQVSKKAQGIPQSSTSCWLPVRLSH